MRQGNGEAPEIWAIISTTLLNFLLDAGNGSVLKYWPPRETLRLVGYWLVDDPNTIQVNPSPTSSTEETIRAASKGLNIFSGAYQATGGHILVKIKINYLLEFVLDAAGRWILADNDEQPLLIFLEVNQEMELIPPSYHSIILGVWIAPNFSSL